MINIIYYNPEDGMCPLCADENQNEIVITDKSQLGQKCGGGFESIIFKFGLRSLVKLYKGKEIKDEMSEEIKSFILEENRLKLEKKEGIVKLLRQICEATKKDLENKNFGIVFAQKPVYFQKNEQKVFFGFKQEKVKAPMSFILLADKEVCEELNLSLIDLMKLLIDFGEAIEYLHNSPIIRDIVPEGIVVGDVSGKNALYSKYEKKVYLIDMDSIGVKKYPANVFTAKFFDPIVRLKPYPNNCATFESDYYSYAIACFYILTRMHPFEGVYKDFTGNIVNMPIEKRMEKRISVLGNNKIKLPEIAKSWDWMSKELEKAFLDIFEKGKRYSILPMLKKEYEKLTGTKIYENTETLEEVEETEEVLEDTKLVNEGTSDVNDMLNICKLANRNEILSDKLDLIDEKLLYNNILLCDSRFNTDICGNETIYIDLNLKFIEEKYVEGNNGIFTAIDFHENKYIFTLSNGVPKAIYRMSNAKRNFGILYDRLNDIYLLLSYDNSKSYIVMNKKVAKVNEIYKDIDFEKCSTSLYKYFTNHDISKMFYMANSLYYLEDKFICNLNLMEGVIKKLPCNVATEGGFIKIINDSFIIGNEEEIFEITI